MTPDTRNDLLIPRQQLLDAQEATKKCRDTLSEMSGALGARNLQICGLQEELEAAKRRIAELEAAKACTCAICRAEKDHGKP